MDIYISFPPYILLLFVPALVKQPRVGSNWVIGVKLWDKSKQGYGG